MRMLPLLMVAAIFAVVSPALAQETSVGLDSIFAPIRPYLVELIGVVISIFVVWLSSWLRTTFKISVDEKYRVALHNALDNAAKLALSKVDQSVAGRDLNVGHPLVKTGIEYVLKYSPDAIDHFGLRPEQVAEMLRAKLAVQKPVE